MISYEQAQQLPQFNKVTIDETMIDVMGHLNVRHYLGIADDATFECFIQFGMDQAYYDETDGGAFALEQHIRYFAEIRLGETMAVHTRVLGRTAKRVHFIHFLLNETRQNVAATVENVGSHANTVIRRTSPFPAHIAENIDKMMTPHQSLAWDAPICGVIRP